MSGRRPAGRKKRRKIQAGGPHRPPGFLWAILFPVRIERSRDAHRDSAVPTGVSTSLDTNGYRRVPIDEDRYVARLILFNKPYGVLSQDQAGQDRKSTRLNSSH